MEVARIRASDIAKTLRERERITTERRTRRTPPQRGAVRSPSSSSSS